MKRVVIVIFGVYFFSLVCLFLYSFTQVDLGLTLSKVALFHQILQGFQYVGYFLRPLSSVLYGSILLLLFISYGGLVYLAAKKSITLKQVYLLSVCTVGILLFSYNAFSYDLFNYIFDAKIFTHYHLNPYLFKALDFPHEPMLAFMHWTERTYPYGPVWLGISIPLSFLGMNIFVVTMVLFKSLMATCFLGSVYLIRKIAQKISPKQVVLPMVLFACNPLVIIESLVSSHHDIVMVFLALAAFYFLMQKKYVRALGLLLVSIGIKYATIFLLPVFLIVWFFQWRKKTIDWEWVFTLSGICMIPAIVLAAQRSNFQPWYLLFALPYFLLGKKRVWLFVGVVVMPLFALLEYVPFLFLGNWNPPVPMLLAWLTGSGIILTIVISGIMQLVLQQKRVIE